MAAFGTLAIPAATAILLLFCALVGVVTWNRIREDLFHPLVLVGVILLYFVLAPAGYLLVTRNFKWPHAHTRPISALAIALFVVFVTYILMVLAYRWVDRNRFSPNLEASDLLDRQTNESTVLVWLGLLGFAAGLVFYLYYVTVNGGVVRLVTIIPRNAFQTVPNTGRYRLLGTAGMFAGLITICTGLRPRVKRNDLSRTDYLLLGVLVVVTLGVAASLRSRMNIVIPAAYLLVYFHTSGRISTRAITVGAGTLIVVGGGFTFLEHSLTSETSLEVLFRGFIDPTRFEAFTTVVQTVPAEHSYQYGKTLVWALPVRWPAMPMRYGNQVEVIVLGKTLNHITYPAMMLSELWLNFGPVGLFVGGALFGGALSAVYTLHQRTSGYLAGGLYPLALLTVIVALPTSIEWSLKSMLFRLCIPVVLAVGVAYGYTRFVRAKSWKQRT